jgi:hypothetical protein
LEIITTDHALLAVLDWSDVAAFVTLPFFRHPIEIYVRILLRGSEADVVASFVRNSVLKKLIENGNLVIKF